MARLTVNPKDCKRSKRLLSFLVISLLLGSLIVPALGTGELVLTETSIASETSHLDVFPDCTYTTDCHVGLPRSGRSVMQAEGRTYSFDVATDGDIHYNSTTDGQTWDIEDQISPAARIPYSRTGSTFSVYYDQDTSTFYLAYYSESNSEGLAEFIIYNGTVLPTGYLQIDNVYLFDNGGGLNKLDHPASIMLAGTTNYIYAIASYITISTTNPTTNLFRATKGTVGFSSVSSVASGLTVFNYPSISELPDLTDAVIFAYSGTPGGFRYRIWNGSAISTSGELNKGKGYDGVFGGHRVSFATNQSSLKAYAIGYIENPFITPATYYAYTFNSSGLLQTVGWNQTDYPGYKAGYWSTAIYADTSSLLLVYGNSTGHVLYRTMNISTYDLGDEQYLLDAGGSLMKMNYAYDGASFDILQLELTNSSIEVNFLAHPITPGGRLEITGLKCGNIWVTPDKTLLTITATVWTGSAIQNVSVRFNDSLHVIQADYDNTTERWNLSQGRDYVTLDPQATATSYYSTGPDNYTLQVEFMMLANEQILDRDDTDVEFNFWTQSGVEFGWSSNATMNIYNKGGATEYYIQNDAGFLAGPDVYSVYAKNTSSIGVNQTWVRLQHLHANFGIRLILNSTNSGEDNLWQDLGHKGTNEYYTNSTDWTIYYKIWYYDEQNEAWVQGWILSFVKQQGDIGTSDEWTEFNVTFYNGPNSEKTSSQNMSAWVEREPEARVRLWLDLWFNKINASSVHGARLNPMYFGLHYTGWAMWGTGIAGQWEPMYKNETEAVAFDRLQDANAVENITSPMLTCMKTEQILVMNDNTYAIEGLDPLHYNYTIQIDNWDIFEPKLSPTRNMEGVNTPLIVEPLLPDKTATSFWAPIYAGLQSIGGYVFKAFASLAEIVWQAVRAQFPWFAEWVDNVNALLANGIEASNQMLSGLVELLKMVGGQVWIFGFITDFIQQTWEYLYPLLSPFTENATVWLTLLIIVFGILPIADNLTRGRWDLVQDDLEKIWGFMRTVIVGIYVIVSTLVNWLISAIPL